MMTEPERLAERAAEHLILNYTSFVPSELSRLPVYVRAEGCWVWDARGNKYLDAASCIGSMALGHSHGSEIGAAIQEQLSRLPFWHCWSASHPPAIDLAEALAAIAPPSLDHVYFVQSGSEANESALKLTRQYHQARGESRRYKVLARKAAFHGLTQGALALTGIPPMREPYEPLPAGVRHLSSTNAYRHPAGGNEEQLTTALLTEAEEAIRQESPELMAAIIAEPVQTSGGCFVPPAGYFEGLRRLCDEYGLLLIADEVITGFGRLGEWFGSQRYGIDADILTFAKAATAGHAPLGGMLISDRVLDPLVEAGATFKHGSTFSGHPASMAAGLKALEIMRRERVLDNVRSREGSLAASLAELKRHPLVGDVRGAGFLWAIEIVKDQESKELFAPAEANIVLHEIISTRLLEHGLLCRADNERGDPVITLTPPLVAEDAELDWMVEVLDAVLAEASVEAAALS